MTEERITQFLYHFYKVYLKNCFLGIQADALSKEIAEKLKGYHVDGYLADNLDIYIQYCDKAKEYSTICQPILLQARREDNPELFNQLEIFLIENIQLFVYTIIEEAFKQYLSLDFTKEGVRLKFLPIDNHKVKWLDLVAEAEQTMLANGFNPPSRG